ncbi:MAG TPA: MarR family transcriptional regulator [Kofleriaceae bacterium]|jgi:DNA-binding MarR family transcriptional regulator|nr:MarR family transcriptional regulator [Kofleriaceae bacterium]
MAVARVADVDRRLRMAAAGRLGVGATDFDALLLLDTAGPVAAGRIAEAMAITTGAVTGLIDRLERAGWVQRTRHESDRRQVLIELAPARRDQLDAHWKDRDRFVAEAIGELDDAALGEAARLIDAIAEHTLASLADGAAGAARGDDAGDGERAPLAGVEHGRLRFVSGGARIELRGARIDDLYRATFRGKRPQIAVEPDGLVTVQYKGFGWFGMTGVPDQIALTTAVPWAIEIRRGVSHLTADLRELEVTGIDITGGANECELALPRPRGHATLRATGGASRLVVKRPRGTAARIVIRGGASSFVFDDQRIGADGGEIRLSTPGWDSAPDRWTIELAGGASNLSVTEQ